MLEAHRQSLQEIFSRLNKKLKVIFHMHMQVRNSDRSFPYKLQVSCQPYIIFRPYGIERSLLVSLITHILLVITFFVQEHNI